MTGFIGLEHYLDVVRIYLNSEKDQVQVLMRFEGLIEDLRAKVVKISIEMQQKPPILRLFQDLHID